MIEPLLSDGALLSDISLARAEAEAFHIWWLGQSGYLIQWQGRHLLVDPYLSESLTRKYASTDKPHVRMTRRAVDPARLDFIDLVTSSHFHTDHLDPETLRPLFAANPRLEIVAPVAQRAMTADRAGIAPGRVIGVDDGESVEIAGFSVTAVPSAHETIERDEQGHLRFLGYVFRFGSFAVYHSGDTVRYEGMADRLRPFGVDLALLPINGALPERRVPGNLNGPEAANLARDIGARIVIPCHYDLFEFNTASPDDFAAECRRLGQEFRTLRCGERWSGSRRSGSSVAGGQ